MSRMNVEVHGAGDPVIMVHGLGGNSNVYGPQVETLARFFTCVRPDLPGSGSSACGDTLSLNGMIDYLQSLMDERNLQSVHLVGHSMGTIICQHLAIRAPGRVRSLALLGPMLAPPDAGRNALRERAAKARNEGMRPVAEMIVEAATSAETKSHRPEIVALIRNMLMRNDPEGYALTCEALAAAEVAPVERIACPTLLITGDEDMTAPASVVKDITQRIPGAQMHILSRCAHWEMIERPREVSNLILNFLLSLT